MTNSDTFDLTADQIPPGQQLVAKNKWPIIGEKKPAACDGPWLLEVTGKIKTDLTLSRNDLAGLSQTTLNMDIHCVTRWTRPKVQFRGVLLRDVLERPPGIEHVLFVLSNAAEVL
jgi:DMSO/TMAO reductase YedYZ molybdopterin-dependent catalytic subunit